MVINEMNDVTPDVMQSFQRLVPHLTDHASPPSTRALERMALLESTIIILARDPEIEGRIIGSATLATFETPTGSHGWIEDVVVDWEARRQGVGRALTEACLEKARSMGLKTVNLTSRPSREAANRLYQKIGFQQRETNVYEYRLD